MRRFLVPELPPAGESCALPQGVAHHLSAVLRLAEGARVQLFDGQGMQATARVRMDPNGVLDVIIEEDAKPGRPARDAHLVLALVKPKALDMALRMGTEVGLTHVHIFTAQRSQNRPARLDRWQRVVDSAAQQCGRADTPRLSAHPSLVDALQHLPADLERYIALPGAPTLPAPVQAAAAIVGPEGGLTPSEVELALGQHARPLGLGAWVLRADTAATLAAHFICS